MKPCEFPKCGGNKSRCMCFGSPTDAEAVARAALTERIAPFWDETRKVHDWGASEIDTYRAAVVAPYEAAVARLREYERFVAALDSGEISDVSSVQAGQRRIVVLLTNKDETFRAENSLAAYRAAKEGTDA